MKRISLLFALLIVGLYLRAEVMPTGYYDAINGKKDSVLKTTLNRIIMKDTIRYAYGANQYHTTRQEGQWEIGDLKAYGTWWGFITTDQRSDGSVWDMYSNNTRYLPIAGGSGAGMDIEHCFPKSWWGAIDNAAYKDLYHLNPSDHMANTNKSNYPPGIVSKGDKFDNGSFRMDSKKNSSYGWCVWEPADEYKGDFARAYFYIATAYEDFTWVDTYSDYISNSSYLEFQPWLVEVLLQWHRADPVSEKELNRLNAVSDIQHNRNPYIEYPDLVEYIWGNKKGTAVKLNNLVRTTSEAYTVPTDTINPETFAATNITAIGFDANWKDQARASYSLNVFRRVITGHNDTLLAMPGICKDSINAHSDHVVWLNNDGAAGAYTGVTDGTYGLMLSTSKAGYKVRITNFTMGANTKIVVKAASSKYADANPVLAILGDGDTIQKFPVIVNEQWYTCAIPAGVSQIDVAQETIGQRVTIGQIFLIQGNEQIVETSLAGYPREVHGNTYRVENAFADGGEVYYNVTPNGLRRSNTQKVVYSGTTAIDNTITESNTIVRKIVKDGQILIERNGKIYTAMGQEIR